MDKQAATILIQEDLTNSGFATQIKNDEVFVSLFIRPVTIAEVRVALRNKGYESCQFCLGRHRDKVVVEAIV